MQYAIDARTESRESSRRIVGAGLWTLQGILAALFLFAGAMKFAMPIEAMTEQLPLPAWFLYVTGAVEVLGALGLVLPGIARIRVGLAPLAAAGLVIVMIGATTLCLATPAPEMAVMPLVVGILCATVAYGRGQVAPHRGRHAA
jgi:uncharacterized membrane protein YphA (DoxX/SURF4 family)